MLLFPRKYPLRKIIICVRIFFVNRSCPYATARICYPVNTTRDTNTCTVNSTLIIYNVSGCAWIQSLTWGHPSFISDHRCIIQCIHMAQYNISRPRCNNLRINQTDCKTDNRRLQTNRICIAFNWFGTIRRRYVQTI